MSTAQNAAILPSPSVSVSNAIRAFASKGLNATDMVYLLGNAPLQFHSCLLLGLNKFHVFKRVTSIYGIPFCLPHVFYVGGHTIGIAHCSLFKDRLYNFKNTGRPDPNMDSSLVSSLKRTCPQFSNGDDTANLDQNPFSSAVVDKSFYSQIMQRRGVLQIDQEIALDSLTKSTVEAIARSADFNFKFGQAMVKLGATQVLTGTQGEIRQSCRAVKGKSLGDSLFN